ncbi:MAG: hypothetical protein JZD40_00185 [Sulfolobus sp.]|nr:hypothetical protein [Sulfolobus sp.]
MKLIRDAIHGLIEVDDDTLKVISTSLFQRLRYITQNGMSYLVYPSMRHSRFEHSLGSYHISKLILKNFSFDEILRERLNC